MSTAAFIFVFTTTTLCAGEITGATRYNRSLVTWGAELRLWDPNSLKSTILVEDGKERGEGGCVFDGGIVLQEGRPFGDLVIRRPPQWRAERMDNSIQMHDCIAATIDGRHGVLVIHRFAQIRFYTPPESANGERWPYRELYSIYTPSKQTGLLRAPYGILAGNYWLEPSAASPEAAWREFAINTWTETADSASMRMAWMGAGLIVAQGHLVAARLARFTPSASRTQLWNEQRLGEELKLRYPHAMAADERRLIVGENAGAGSRLFLFTGDLSMPVLLGTTGGTHSALLFGDAAITVGASGVRRWDLTAGEDRRRRPESNPHGAAKKRR